MKKVSAKASKGRTSKGRTSKGRTSRKNVNKNINSKQILDNMVYSIMNNKNISSLVKKVVKQIPKKKYDELINHYLILCNENHNMDDINKAKAFLNTLIPKSGGARDGPEVSAFENLLIMTGTGLAIASIIMGLVAGEFDPTLSQTAAIAAGAYQFGYEVLGPRRQRLREARAARDGGIVPPRYNTLPPRYNGGIAPPGYNNLPPGYNNLPRPKSRD